MSRRAAGLRWERISDAVRSFVREQGAASPRRAVLCTYDFDPEHFQAVLFPALTRRGKEFRTLILADAGVLQQTLLSHGQRVFDRYEVAPARCLRGGVFHPKIILLQARNNYLVGIGSSNLTRGGFGGNLELMLFADQSGPEGETLIRGVASFLTRLMASGGVVLPRTACNFVRKTLAGVKPLRNIVLDSLEAPLLDQMVQAHHRAVGGAPKALSIVSPWHSSAASPDGTDPKVVAEFRRRFAVDGPIRIYTQGHNGAGPDLGRGVEVQITQETPLTNTDSPEAAVDAEHDRRPTKLHAKAYLVCGSRSGTFFFGSANCTQPALTRSVARQGNVEVLVGSKLEETGVRAIEKDLKQLFGNAAKKSHAERQQRPPAPRGLILAAQIISSAGRTVLSVEAPGITGGDIAIASSPRNVGSVIVSVKNGFGEVREESQLRKLFQPAQPSRQSESWCSVLWEKVQRKFVPFLVTVPLAEPSSARPDEAIFEILEEECGWWPREKTEVSEDRTEDWTSENETADHADDTTAEKDAWTEANHQGELDRIAVAAALLRRRIRQQFEGPDVRRAYLRQLQERIDSIQLAPHLAKVLRTFFRA